MTMTLTSSQFSVYKETHQEMMEFLRGVYGGEEQSYTYIMHELSLLYDNLLSTHDDATALKYVEDDYQMVADFAITLAKNIKRSRQAVVEPIKQNNALNMTVDN